MALLFEYGPEIKNKRVVFPDGVKSEMGKIVSALKPAIDDNAPGSKIAKSLVADTSYNRKGKNAHQNGAGLEAVDIPAPVDMPLGKDRDDLAALEGVGYHAERVEARVLPVYRYAAHKAENEPAKLGIVKFLHAYEALPPVPQAVDKIQGIEIARVIR